jgi:hypothetical protein
MKIKLLLSLLLLAGICVGCRKESYGPELQESGEVYDLCFVPKGHGSDTAVGFNSEGHVTVTPIDIKIPPRFAVVFKCQHGKFVVDGERGQSLYNQLNKGDAVTIRYCEVLESNDGKTNAVDLRFIGVIVNK